MNTLKMMVLFFMVGTAWSCKSSHGDSALESNGTGSSKSKVAHLQGKFWVNEHEENGAPYQLLIPGDPNTYSVDLVTHSFLPKLSNAINALNGKNVTVIGQISKKGSPSSPVGTIVVNFISEKKAMAAGTFFNNANNPDSAPLMSVDGFSVPLIIAFRNPTQAAQSKSLTSHPAIVIGDFTPSSNPMSPSQIRVDQLFSDDGRD